MAKLERHVRELRLRLNTGLDEAGAILDEGTIRSAPCWVITGYRKTVNGYHTHAPEDLYFGPGGGGSSQVRS